MDEIDSQPNELAGLVILVSLAATGIITRVQNWLEELPAAHRRGARLQACRRRHQWRKADVPKLRDLGVCKPAEMRLRRIESASGRGRGVIGKYQSPDAVVIAVIKYLSALFSPMTAPHTRLALFKKGPWCAAAVEALYRGEHAACKDAGQKSPSETAERTIGYRLGMSPAAVRKLCTTVRRERGDALPDCPALTLSSFEIWLRQGGDLWLDTPQSPAAVSAA